MLRLWTTTTLGLLLVVLTACPEPAPTPDGGAPEPPADAGDVDVDGGEGADSGLVVDGGGVVLDSGLLVDGGDVVVDAGAAPDGGVAVVDSGVGLDGGVAVDSGVVMDAGSVADAGRAPDAGVDGGTLVGIDALLQQLRSPTLTPQEADAVLQQVALGDRWPLVDDGRWLFATRWDDATGQVSLVSDINGWVPGAHTAEVAATGVHFFVVVDEGAFTTAASGSKYKWHAADGDVYRAGPEATAHGWDAFGAFGWVAPPVDAQWLERYPAFVSQHLTPRTVRLRFPPGYVAGVSDARVLLMHDGQNLFDPNAIWGGWHVDDALHSPTYDDVVVVAVDNSFDRMDAYTHVADDIGENTVVGGNADAYLAMLREEVLPFAADRFGVDVTAGRLAVGGSSLGGLISLYYALQFDGEASCVIAMSPTLGWGAFAASTTQEASDALVHRWDGLGLGSTAIYLDSGGSIDGACADLDGDGVHEDNNDNDNFCVTSQMRDQLAVHGYVFGVDLFHFHEPGAPHNEAAWAARLPGALAACDSAGWQVP